MFLEVDDPRALATALEALDLRFGSEPEPVTITLLPQLDLPKEIEERLRAALGAPKASESLWVLGGRAALERRFLDAAEIYSRMPYRPAEAYARLRAAEQLVGEGRRAEADDQLQRALGFWRAVAATRYIRHGVRLLAATA